MEYNDLDMMDIIFYNYVAYTIMRYKNIGYDIVLFQKSIKARCPVCNSEVKESIDEGQIAHYECKNCLSQFVVDKIGSIYYIISYKNETI